jgi:hypothetical protein
MMFAVFLIHTKIVTGSFNGGNLWETFVGRVSNAGQIGPFGNFSGYIPGYANYSDFLCLFRNMLVENFSGFFISACSIFTAIIIFNIFNARKLLKKEIIVFLTGIYFTGFLYLLIFNSFTYYHEYSLLYIIPCFTISTVLLIYLLFSLFADAIFNKLKIRAETSKELLINLGLSVLLMGLYCARIFEGR